MIETIVKIQRPLNDPKAPWLVYDETRAVHRLMPVRDVPRAVIVDAAGLAKLYYHAVIVDKALRFIRRAAQQNW